MSAAVQWRDNQVYCPCHELQVPGTGQDALYATGRVHHAGQVLLELRLVQGRPGVDVAFKSERQDLADAVITAVRSSLT